MSPDFRAHPEFGYFCLSQKFRRKARNVLASSVAVGVVMFVSDYLVPRPSVRGAPEGPQPSRRSCLRRDRSKARAGTKRRSMASNPDRFPAG